MPNEPDGKSSDLRRSARIRMDAPVEFADGKGVTRDLSTTGVYFICDTPLKAGMRLAVTIEVDDTLADMPVRMDFHGTVVRVDAMDGEQVGVAMKLDKSKPRR